MRVAPVSTIFAFLSITILIHALPFAPPEPQRPQAHFKRVPYSVVAVDGSSPSSTSVAAGTETKTVTQATEATRTVIATLPPSILTIVATITVSEQESEKTVFVTPTTTPPAETTISVVPLPVSISLSSSLSISSTPPISSTPSPISPLYVPSSSSPLTTSTTGTPQKLSTAQLPLSTVSFLPLPIATPVTPSSVLIPSNTSNTTNLGRPTITTSYDDGSWHTSYRAWSLMPSSISMSTSTSSTDVPSFSSITEKYAATVTPSPTRQDYISTGGVASGNNGVYSGTSLRSWNGTTV